MKDLKIKYKQYTLLFMLFNQITIPNQKKKKKNYRSN